MIFDDKTKSLLIDGDMYLSTFNRCGCHQNGIVIGKNSTHELETFGRRTWVRCKTCKSEWLTEPGMDRL